MDWPLSIFQCQFSEVFDIFMKTTRPSRKPKGHNRKTHPMFFELLSPDDQDEYELVRERFSSQSRHQRSKGEEDPFDGLLKTLKSYVVRGNDEDSIRSLVCGVAWLSSGLAINTQQLSIVLNRCKSSINGSLKTLGYGTVPNGALCCRELLTLFPFLGNQFPLLRQWTVRQKIDPSQSKRLRDIIQQCRPNKIAEEDISPPPTLPGSRFVESYLNDECSLGDMVRAIIKERETLDTSDEDDVTFLFDEQTV